MQRSIVAVRSAKLAKCGTRPCIGKTWSKQAWLHSLAVQRCGSGFRGAASSTHVLVSGTAISNYFPYFCICGSSGWASVMVRPWKAGNYLKIDNWSVFVLFGWRFVFGIIMRWEGREPFQSDVITTLGNNKAASLLLSFKKVSSTKDQGLAS